MLKKQRPLPSELLPFCEQSLLNLVLRGADVYTADGQRLSVSLIAQADRINAEYEKALQHWRNGKSLQPEGVQKTIQAAKKKPIPKPGPQVKKS